MQKITPDFLSQANKKRIKIKNGELSSRFRIDLGAMARVEEARLEEENRPYLKKMFSRSRDHFNKEEDSSQEKSDILLGFE